MDRNDGLMAFSAWVIREDYNKNTKDEQGWDANEKESGKKWWV